MSKYCWPRITIEQVSAQRPAGYLAAMEATNKSTDPATICVTPEDYAVIRQRFAPGALKTAGNFAGAVAAETAAISKGNLSVSSDQKEGRLAVCQECPERIGDGTSARCSICNCFLVVKAGWRSQSCPLGKWPPLPA